MAEERLMTFPVPSDPLGKELKPGGLIGLQRIEFNRTKWVAPDPLTAIALVEGCDLVIRREGAVIHILRQKTG